MQLSVIPPIEPAVNVASAHCKAGQVICYPTDTLYGLGGDARDGGAVRRIFEIKGRGVQSPFSVVFSDVGMMQEYVKMSAKEAAFVKSLTPGPFTFILPVAKRLPVSDDDTLGCRIPSHDFCLKLSASLGGPVISTSANLHGKPAAKSAEELDERILHSVSLLVDGGPCQYGMGSTIIDVAHKRIVREGAMLEKARLALQKL